MASAVTTFSARYRHRMAWLDSETGLHARPGAAGRTVCGWNCMDQARLDHFWPLFTSGRQPVPVIAELPVCGNCERGAAEALRG